MSENRKNKGIKKSRTPQTAEVLWNYVPQTSTSIHHILEDQSHTGTTSSKATSILPAEKFYRICEEPEQYTDPSVPIFANEQERRSFQVKEVLQPRLRLNFETQFGLVIQIKIA